MRYTNPRLLYFTLLTLSKKLKIETNKKSITFEHVIADMGNYNG